MAFTSFWSKFNSFLVSNGVLLTIKTNYFTTIRLYFRIQHYANQSDIQMAGMLSCAFSYRLENPDVAQTRLSSKSINVSVSTLYLFFVDIKMF